MQLDELISNAIGSLKNSQKQPNEDTVYAIINKDLTSFTMEKLKEQLTIFLGKEKPFNKPHRWKNSYFTI